MVGPNVDMVAVELVADLGRGWSGLLSLISDSVHC